MKKRSDKTVIIENGKPLGCLTDDEWKKEKKRSLFNTSVMMGAVILIVCLVFGGAYAYNNFNNGHFLTATPESSYSTIKLFESENMQTFQIKTNGTYLNLSIEVKSDEANETWYNLGEFHLEFTRVQMFNGGVPSDAYVLYYPPKDWYIKVASEKAKYEEIHVEVPKQKVGVDPTFYKEKDFPYDVYPYDEIEITTNKVIKLVELNQTIYDFRVRVKESNKKFNIVDMRVKYV